jgi:hypothetical protein
MTPSNLAWKVAVASLMLTLVGVVAVVAAVSYRRPAVVSMSPQFPSLPPPERLASNPGRDQRLLQGLPAAPDGLSEVGLYVESAGIGANAELTLTDEQGSVLRRAVADVGSDNQLRFKFPPILDPSRRSLLVAITARPAQAPGGLTFLVSPVRAGQAPLQEPPEGSGRTLLLRLRTGASQPVLTQAGAILNRAAQYRPGSFKVLGIIASLAVAALAAMMVVLLVTLAEAPLLETDLADKPAG